MWQGFSYKKLPHHHKILKLAPTTNYFSFHKSPAGHKMSPTSLLKPFSLYSQYWTRIGFGTIPNCDVNNHARRPVSLSLSPERAFTDRNECENSLLLLCQRRTPIHRVKHKHSTVGLEGNFKSFISLALCTEREFKWDSNDLHEMNSFWTFLIYSSAV